VIVLDASALVDVIADRPRKDAVLEHLDQPLVAPGHQLAEVSSAVIRLLRAGELTQAAAKRALSDAATLIQEVAVLDEGLILRAFALRDSLRILDGLYVALSEQRNCPLLTTDGRLARADPPCELILAGAGD
jgi:predicted nucleic acid-binding protein